MGQPDPISLGSPQCPKGIGDLIVSKDSPKLIQGVQVQPQVLWPDDRGYFMEIHRLTKGMAGDFPPDSQISCALSYPGTIKAFHFHRFQTDCWTPVAGLLQVALVDLRDSSPTFGSRNTLFVGNLRPWQIRIPPGVAHGYKVIGGEPAILVYMTDRVYNPDDEGRIAYDDPGIHYDWEIQHK